MEIRSEITFKSLSAATGQVFDAAQAATHRLKERASELEGAPVFTVRGRYLPKGWTEWTQGFQFGNAVLLFDALGDERLLEYGRGETVRRMAPHLTHTGVHDHGFNNVSTYGNLLRLSYEGRIPKDDWEREFYRLALKVSGCVQAARWTPLPGGLGYVPSFNGAHSLFADTIRSMRSLAVGYRMGAELHGEQDARISLLTRLLKHSETTARYNVYFGAGRDRWDIPGRVVHESLFNVDSGSYRAPSSQQGYSPFTTWTRGHAWILCGFAELLEFLEKVDDSEFEKHGIDGLHSKSSVLGRFREVATTVAEFYIEHTARDGIPYWDTGAPGLVRLGEWRAKPADPWNNHEPVDSSAAAIGAQGLLRLGRVLGSRGNRYVAAGLTVCSTLFGDPYLSRDDAHEGILLHSLYHRPNRWDHEPDSDGIARGESCMWGDYHLLELALYVSRLAQDGPYLAFDPEMTRGSG